MNLICQFFQTNPWKLHKIRVTVLDFEGEEVPADVKQDAFNQIEEHLEQSGLRLNDLTIARPFGWFKESELIAKYGPLDFTQTGVPAP